MLPSCVESCLCSPAEQHAVFTVTSSIMFGSSLFGEIYDSEGYLSNTFLHVGEWRTVAKFHPY